MKKEVLMGLVHFFGWILFASSAFIVITGLIANSGKTAEYAIISSFLGFAAFGFFLTRYKKKPELLSRERMARRPVKSRIPRKLQKPDSAISVELKNNVFHIWYKDSVGSVTEREIEIFKLSVKEEKVYILAFCHLHHFVRIFDVDQIVKMTENGKTIDIREYLRRYNIQQSGNTLAPEESA